MTRRIATTLAAALLGLSMTATAQAQMNRAPTEKPGMEPGTHVSAPMEKASSQQNVNKHLALVDAYLLNVTNSTKALSELSNYKLTAKDRKEIDELHKSITSSITGAQTHLKEIRTLAKSERQPVAGTEMTTNIDQIESSLRKAKESAKNLKTTDSAKLQIAVEQFSGDLNNAQQAFDSLARSANFTSLSNVQLKGVGAERMPVRGKTPEKGFDSKGYDTTAPRSPTLPEKSPSSSKPGGYNR